MQSVSRTWASGVSYYIVVHVTFLFCFQDNQRDLESATEQLSEYLERDICAENLVDIKQKVQDKYRWKFISNLKSEKQSKLFWWGVDLKILTLCLKGLSLPFIEKPRKYLIWSHCKCIHANFFVWDFSIMRIWEWKVLTLFLCIVCIVQITNRHLLVR